MGAIHQDMYDLNNLLLPLGNRVGAISKVNNLIAELSHPNIDWKYVITGIRAYLYDYLHDIIPHSPQVLPILFHFLREGTLRKKGSALRASDTFFDRYIHIMKNAGADNGNLGKLKPFFDTEVRDYLDMMIEESRQGFFFGEVNQRVRSLGMLMLDDPRPDRDIVGRINDFLVSQYRLYMENSIAVEDDEINRLKDIMGEGAEEFYELLGRVSKRRFGDDADVLESISAAPGKGEWNKIQQRVDFTFAAKSWERICLLSRKLIEEGTVNDNDAILELLAFIIRKSQEGNDRKLQLFMSRTVASVCGILDRIKKGELLIDVIDMVMPPLITEIDKGGNFYSAFATIYNIGRVVIESGRISVIDHFVDILVKSKFCFPQFSGIASDWSVIVNSSHLENIRTWLRLIELNPPVLKKLAAALIVNLKMGGVFLKDTDVFQRDISSLLNSSYADVFYLITSLAAVFPAFYHDIGATGNIRAFTEKIDTNHQMDDLIHFLRKQVHVESSSRTVLLIQRTMDFWLSGNREPLKGMVPREVYDNLERIFRLINLDQEKNPVTIIDKAREYFPEYGDLHFWDFLSAVEKNRFMEFISQTDFEGISSGEKAEIAECFCEYFDKRFPAEMTKMLHYIRSMFDIDISRKQIWKFLYEISDDEFREIFTSVRFLDVSKINIEKFITFLHVYRMIYDKYNFSEVRDIEKLEGYAKENLFEPTEGFFERIKGNDIFAALKALLDLQSRLKSEVLLSGATYDPVDTIEFKRHIAFGIPSMYGSYKEKKFDTLKVFFHCNLIRERLFESLVETSKSFPYETVDYEEIKRVLSLFCQTFEIDGLANHELRSIISLLDTPNLRISQIRDIVNALFSAHGEIADRFNETYKYVCKIIINNLGTERIKENYLPDESLWNIEVIIDRFLRDQIMQSSQLQLFDRLLIRLKERLNHEIGVRGDHVCLNICDMRRIKGKLFYPIERYAGTHKRGELLVPLWYTGGKAQGLIIAANIEDLNVPRGFVISSEMYKRLGDGDIRNPRFQRKMIYLLKKYVDELTENRFANPENPILLSVRSGAVFSMPGVMDTITNVGVTQEIIEYYARFDPWFAYDCYRRLIHDFAISYYGMDRHLFEGLMAQTKEDAGVDLKEKLNGRQMESMTKKYRYALNKAGYSIFKDPYEQLFFAIIAVFQSWNSDVAKNYRQFINISEEWGTAVIVQKMVFGNVSPISITGVVHSQYIGYENIGLFGEYKTRAQGHDVVSGVARVFPISEAQRSKYASSSMFPSLEKTYPAHYRKIHDAIKKVREWWGNEVEVEFTFENEVLYILQIRGLATHNFETEEPAESPAELQQYFLGQGLAASGGAVSGRVVFNIGRIDKVRTRYPGDKIIIVRPETNPEDVVGIQKSEGILTCVGGMTSHAVLQMRRLEKSGVSDFSRMRIDEKNNMAIVSREPFEKGKIIVREGDFITIDGSNGHVYLGFHPTVKKGL